MATANSVIALRDNTSNSIGSLVASCNNIHQLILDSGMTQVAPDEYTGQALIFSETAGVGLTLVSRNDAAGEHIVGYKVYRHPTLAVYVRVNYLDIKIASGASIMGLSYQVSTKLQSGIFDPLYVSPVFKPLAYSTGSFGNATHDLGVVPNTALAITASCGSSYFWLSRSQGVRIHPSTQNASFPTSRVDPLSFGIFFSENNGSDICVVLPQDTLFPPSSDYTGYLGANCVNVSGFSGINYITYSNGSWVKRQPCCAGFVIDSAIRSNAEGIRVVQAEIVIGGESNRFNFGFIPFGTLPEFDSVNINLNSIPQKYKSLPSIGSAGFAAPVQAGQSYSTIVFPVTE